MATNTKHSTQDTNIRAELRQLRQDVNFLYYVLMYHLGSEWDPTYVIDDIRDRVAESHRNNFPEYRDPERVKDILFNLNHLRTRLETLYEHTEEILYGTKRGSIRKPTYREQFRSGIKDLKATMQWAAKSMQRMMKILDSAEKFTNTQNTQHGTQTDKA